jgi:hypothetical protein
MFFPFRTEIIVHKSTSVFDYNAPALLIGSCFSNNIGDLLNRLKFPVLINPFGVLYNPMSILNAIRMIIEKREVIRQQLIFHNGLWHSLDFHGDFSSPNAEEVISRCNQAIHQAHDFLLKSRFLVVTFGTSWAFTHNDSRQIVANCHKIEATQFTRSRINIREITDAWGKLLSELKSFNPNLQLIFTVSPIRHLSDGFHENQLSKSVLLLAIDELANSLPELNIEYFPSYEIMMDDLRDYRFYNPDMTHISETGVKYIFEKFKQTYFSEQPLKLCEKIEKIKQAYEHKIMIGETESTKKFAGSMLKKIEQIEQQYPYIRFIQEKEYFKKLVT